MTEATYNFIVSSKTYLNSQVISKRKSTKSQHIEQNERAVSGHGPTGPGHHRAAGRGCGPWSGFFNLPVFLTKVNFFHKSQHMKEAAYNFIVSSKTYLNSQVISKRKSTKSQHIYRRLLHRARPGPCRGLMRRPMARSGNGPCRPWLASTGPGRATDRAKRPGQILIMYDFETEGVPNYLSPKTPMATDCIDCIGPPFFKPSRNHSICRAILIFYNLALFLKKVHNWTSGKLKCRNGPRGSAPCIMASRYHVSTPWITAPRS